MSANQFCSGCGKAFAADEKFCTNCGTARPAVANQATELFSTPDQSDSAVVFQPPTATKAPRIGKRAITLIVTASLMLGLGGGGYWYSFVRYDYSATTLSAFMSNNSSRVNAFVENSCPSLDSLASDLTEEIIYLDVSIDLDYTDALYQQSNWVSQTSTKYSTWAANYFRSELGENYAKLDKPTALETQLITQAEEICQPETAKATVLKLAGDLDSAIRKIKSPGNWEPNDYYQSDEDPNLAWRWAPSYSYSCNYFADGCMRVYVRANISCPGRVKVALTQHYSEYGSALDTEYGYISNVRRGSTFTITINNYGTYYRWWGMDSLTCET